MGSKNDVWGGGGYKGSLRWRSLLTFLEVKICLGGGGGAGGCNRVVLGGGGGGGGGCSNMSPGGGGGGCK